MSYWKDCVTEALEDSGVKATDEQIDNIVSWVEGAHENYSLATGEECIPHPLEAEIEAIKKSTIKQEDAHRKQLDGVRSGVAFRRRVSADSVHIDDDGHVTYGN